jgi:hypothetical protein
MIQDVANKEFSRMEMSTLWMVLWYNRSRENMVARLDNLTLKLYGLQGDIPSVGQVDIGRILLDNVAVRKSDCADFKKKCEAMSVGISCKTRVLQEAIAAKERERDAALGGVVW